MKVANSPAIFNDGELTMSSREIAELLEKRHDKVKQSVERLADRGVIAHPPTGDVQETGGNNRLYTTTEYRLDKRASLIVVAQLSPEFTARVVDRWQQLETEKAQGFQLPDFTNPAEAARAWADEVEKGQILAGQVTAMRPAVEAHERLMKADGSVTITAAAKNLGVRPKDLFDWMASHGWIYRRPGSALWLGYAPKCNAGHLEHKCTTVLRADGSEKVTEQVRVTASGLSRLSKLVPVVAREASQ